MTGLALGNLLHRRMRTLIAAAAIAVEVAFLMLLIGLTTGTLREAGERIENIQSDIILLPPGAQLMLAMSSAVMPLEPARAALETTDGVRVAAPVVFASTNHFGGFVLMFGIEPRSYALAGRGGFDFVSGRGIEGPDDVVVDARLQRANGLKVGQKVELLNHEFTISGVVRDGAGVRIYLPIATVQDLLGRQGKASAFFVRSTSPEKVPSVLEALKMSPAFKGFQVIASRQYAEMLGTNAFGLKQFNAAITSIGVVFGFLVISLAMYTTIMERTRQIGVLKSLGAGQLYILRSILLETALLCLIGIPLGFAIAGLAKWVLQVSYPTLIIMFTPHWALNSSLLALIGGILGGLYPALRAARVDPVVALGYEVIMDVVRTQALTKSYRLGKIDVPALAGVDFSVGEGAFIAVMGPSGCGKTTLLHLLGGLDRATSGHVSVDGVDLAGLSDAGRTRLRRDKIGFVFQRFNLLPTLSALGNLELAARIKGLEPKSASHLRLLELVGLAHKARARPIEMSIGEQQRVAVARALVGDPRLVLADEPTGSLDSENSRRILELFTEVNRKLNQTLVMVTHSDEAAGYAHAIVRMRDGRIVS